MITRKKLADAGLHAVRDEFVRVYPIGVFPEEGDWTLDSQLAVLKTDLRKHFSLMVDHRIFPVWSMKKHHFYDWNMLGAAVSRLDFRECRFEHCCLRHSQFAGCCLRWATFINCELYGSCFDKADLLNCAFIGCNLIHARFTLPLPRRTLFEDCSGMERPTAAFEESRSFRKCLKIAQ